MNSGDFRAIPLGSAEVAADSFSEVGMRADSRKIFLED
jgi:hypothetical protein